MKINVGFFSPSDCFSVQFLRKSNFNFIDTYKIDVTESQSNQYSNQFVGITWNTFPWSFKSAFKRINFIEYRMWQLLFASYNSTGKFGLTDRSAAATVPYIK